MILQTERVLTNQEVDRFIEDASFRKAIVRTFVYVVKFVEKHNGGIGVPGGRLEFQTEGSLELFTREGGEELGIKFVEGQVIPITTRCAVGRDIRKKVSPHIYTHGVPLPEEI